MKADFPSTLAAVLKTEGGFTDNRRDPGGKTNKGVTQHEYDAWRAKHGQPARDVRLISDDELTAVYRDDYWRPCRCDDLPAGVDYCVFDFAVNSGPGTAAKFLQRAVGVADDGHIGPATLAAVNAADPRRVINAVCEQRLSFMKSHCDWADFGKGWQRRVTSVEITCRGMCR